MLPPIKVDGATYLLYQGLHNPPVQAKSRLGATGGPFASIQWNASLSPGPRAHLIWTLPLGTESAPYLAALVASRELSLPVPEQHYGGLLLSPLSFRDVARDFETPMSVPQSSLTAETVSEISIKLPSFR